MPKCGVLTNANFALVYLGDTLPEWSSYQKHRQEVCKATAKALMYMRHATHTATAGAGRVCPRSLSMQ